MVAVSRNIKLSTTVIHRDLSSDHSSSAVVVVVYRPGSMSVQLLFFDELATVLDRFATHQEPFYGVGDFNIWLDHPDDPHADQFRLLVDCHRLKLHATGPTHHLGYHHTEDYWLP